MDILSIIGIGIIATVLSLILKKERPEIASVISALGSVVIFSFVLTKIQSTVDLITMISEKTNLDFSYIAIILKVIGISYLAEIGASVCKDAGESAIASKIEMAAKILILTLSVPIIKSLLTLLVSIIP